MVNLDELHEQCERNYPVKVWRISSGLLHVCMTTLFFHYSLRSYFFTFNISQISVFVTYLVHCSSNTHSQAACLDLFVKSKCSLPNNSRFLASVFSTIPPSCLPKVLFLYWHYIKGHHTAGAITLRWCNFMILRFKSELKCWEDLVINK